MDQVSRPLQVVMLVTVLFAAVWFVALRPKSDSGGGPEPAARSQAPAGSPGSAQKSAIPGGLGRAVDKARATKVQGDAAAARSGRVDAAADPAPAGGAPASPARKPTPAGSPGPGLMSSANGAVSAGAVAAGMVGAAVQRALGSPGALPAAAPSRPQAAARRRPGLATPGKVRLALAGGDAVVLLFFNARASDDRAVRSELAAVSRRGGRVKVWAVSVRGLSRFKNVLRGVQVLQSPTVVVLGRRAQPAAFSGYTDRAEIDQAAAVALGR
jgi:hypothetical protein